MCIAVIRPICATFQHYPRFVLLEYALGLDFGVGVRACAWCVGVESELSRVVLGLE